MRGRVAAAVSEFPFHVLVGVAWFRSWLQHLRDGPGGGGRGRLRSTTLGGAHFMASDDTDHPGDP